MTILGSLLAERRTIRDNDLWGGWAAGEDGIAADPASGARVTRNSALGLSAVWACVRIIADTIATLPVDTFLINDEGVKTRYRPKPAWMDTPNPEQSPADFVFGIVASLLLDGNAFIYTVRNRLGDVVEAWVIDPQWVQIRREYVPGGELALVYYIMVGKGQQSPVGPLRVVAGPDMFHITAFNPNSNWPRGLSPIEVARQMLGAGIANQEMGARFYGQGMNASGVLETDQDVPGPVAKAIKRDFVRSNHSVRRMHLPPVLTNGLKWKAISINPEQAQFLESRQFVVQDVARWFGVPLWMIQSNEKTTSWGSGVEQQGIAFATYTIGSWIERIQQGWKRGMLMPFDPPELGFRFNIRKLLRGDHTALASFYNAGRLGGWLCADDIRLDQDMTPLPDGTGQIFLQPTNMTAPTNIDPPKQPLQTVQGGTPQGPEPDEDD